MKHTIRQKFIAINLSVAATTLALALAAITLFSFETYKQNAQTFTRSLAEGLSSDLESPLRFDDPKAIAKLLDSGINNKFLQAVFVFDHNNTLVGHFEQSAFKSDTDPFSLAQKRTDGERTEKYSIVGKTLRSKDQAIGFLVVYGDLSFALSNLKNQIWLSLFVFAIAVLAAFLLGQMLHRSITDPIIAKGQDLDDPLLQSAKLASIGTLASGVVHELRNPLSIILGCLELIRRLPLDAQLEDLIGKIRIASERMRKITDHMRIYSRQSKPADWKVIDLGEVIADSTTMLENELKLKSIALVLKNTNQKNTTGNAVEIESVFLNLLSNSSDAFDRVLDNRQKTIEISVRDIGENYEITFKDNASGMPKDVLKRIFEPFFTTKDAGQGTGLGMSLVTSIINRHRGTIQVQSEPGQGTQFTIQLPRTNQSTSAPESTSKAVPLPGGMSNLSVLIVDDEPELSFILESLLKDYLNVFVCNEPLHALDIFRSLRCDILITDVKMPGISGIDLFHKVRAVFKETPVLFISADEDREIRELTKQPGVAFLIKPFDSLENLLDKIQYLCSSKIKKS